MKCDKNSVLTQKMFSAMQREINRKSRDGALPALSCKKCRDERRGEGRTAKAGILMDISLTSLRQVDTITHKEGTN